MSACTDFYRFANGGWMAKNPIPNDASQRRSTSLLEEHNKEVLRQILEEASKNSRVKKGSNAKKIGDYYGSCMDTSRIESEGTQYLSPEFRRIEAVNDLRSLIAQIAHLHSMGVKAIFNFTSARDFNNPSMIIGEASQRGLGLFIRDYYLDGDSKTGQIREAYLTHIARMFVLLGDTPERARSEAKVVLNIEMKMAQNSMTAAERRDPKATYHKMSIDELDSFMPNFSWKLYFKEIGFPTIKEVNIRQPKFFGFVDQLLRTAGIQDWKIYLRWHLLHTAAQTLPAKFVSEDFEFYGKTFYPRVGAHPESL